jgi:3'(2'), 5'-bisphosphate nucleotidase
MPGINFIKNHLLKNKELELFFLAAMEAAFKASADIMEVYATEFTVTQKYDNSPVTLADQRADDSIRQALASTGEYVLSEEQTPIPYAQRKDLRYIWIVDPLDGTKEFIKKNGEFTVNIALIKNGHPVLSIVTAPALGTCYWAVVGKGVFVLQVQYWEHDFQEILHQSIPVSPRINTVKIIGSRSHANEDTRNYVNLLRAMHPNAETITKGSSLKLCKIATGEAAFYPRFSPINEWDIAAGAGLVEISGGRVLDAATRLPVIFNKENLLQPPFIAITQGINPDTLP